MHLSGNLVEYRKRLIDKLGIERVEALDKSPRTRSYEIDEIKRIKKIYNRKAKKLDD